MLDVNNVSPDALLFGKLSGLDGAFELTTLLHEVAGGALVAVTAA